MDLEGQREENARELEKREHGEEEEMEEDSVGFNPLLLAQRSPIVDGESTESCTVLCDTQDGKEGLADGQEEGSLATEAVRQMFRGSEEFSGQFDGDDKFFELANDYEEDELEDVEQESMLHHYGLVGGSKMDLTETVFKKKAGECSQEYLKGIQYGHSGCIEVDSSAEQNLNSLSRKNGSISVGNILYSAQNKLQEDSNGPFSSIGNRLLRTDESEGDREDTMDAICKRTRAHYSLTDMSLDQLETFLQGSDEDEDFQTAADKEEYEKFLVAVLENEHAMSEKPEQSSRKEDEDDEDEDMDFEVEIEEALESDDTFDSVRMRKRRRPETREKTRQRAQFQFRGPLRHLLPQGASFPNDVSMTEKRNTIMQTGDIFWQSNGKTRAPVNGFTAHQIGQLYCLMHEHVQLLVQVYSLCVWDPTRQQIATDTCRMLQELVIQRDSVLSWKKTAFQEFCFRPPYTHPSHLEGGDRSSFVCSYTPPDATSYTSKSCGQSARISANKAVSYVLDQNTSGIAQAFSLSRNVQQASHSSPYFPPTDHVSRQSQTLQSWKKGDLNVASVTPLSSSVGNSCTESVRSEWAPVTSGPVRSLLDVAPLALVQDFLTKMSQVVQELWRQQLEAGTWQSKFEREPLFVTATLDERDQIIGRDIIEGTRSRLLGVEVLLSACVPPPQTKKTMAAALVESTKKQTLALVPKAVAAVVKQFLPYFNCGMFPHKPPPVATAKRLLFTDAEDELLAMGMIYYNTDWDLIQQRFLPPKSSRQIFIRQKNRSSARALDNSIKAVRRMKTSPLTDLEKMSIQEGLVIYKHDWSKVWRNCVPNRDPSLLRRQWRIAVGTQKSYKTSETSKERRRLYEASRRQKVAAQKAMNALTAIEENAGPSGIGLESDKIVSEENDRDDPDSAYIREAFIDDCSFGNTPVMPSGRAATAEVPRKLVSPFSKRRKGKVQPDCQSSHSLPWLDSQPIKSSCHSRKQTVKLAPGLPSVKLPPHVQVLSQSQVKPLQTFLCSKGPIPATPLCGQITSQGQEKLVFSLPRTKMQPVSMSNCATQATSYTGVSISHQLTGSFTDLSRGQGLTSLKNRAKWVHSPTMEDQRNSLSEQPSGKSALADNGPSQNHYLGDSMSSQWQSGYVQGDTPYSTAIRFASNKSLQALPARREDMMEKMSTDQAGSGYRDEAASRFVALSLPTESLGCHSSQTIAAALVSRDALQFYGFQNPIQLSPSPVLDALPRQDQQAKWKSMSTSGVISESDSSVEFAKILDDRGNAKDLVKHGHFKVRRNSVRRCKKSVCENSTETRNGIKGTSNFPLILKGSLQSRTCLAVEGGTHDPCIFGRQYSSRSTARKHNRRDHKYQDFPAEKGSQGSVMEHHVIVMEQEELSDSEDEGGAGVEFEHEEMGDSDKDAEMEAERIKDIEQFKSK